MPQAPLPMPTPLSSPEPTEAEMMAMPMEQLEQLVFDRAGALNAASVPEGAAPPLGAPPMSPPKPVAAPASPAGPPSNVPADPGLVHAATQALADAGLLPAALDGLTPEDVSKLQAIADDLRPGLYDLSQEDSLNDFLQSLANGTLDLAGDGSPDPGAGADPGRVEPNIPS